MIINTNARSLRPKIESLGECITETEAGLAVITESWLADDERLENDVQDLALGAGMGMICMNRQAVSNGVTYGGVAILWRLNFCSFKAVNIKNPGRFEVLVGAGKIPGHGRKIVVLACYLPPNLTRKKGQRR